MFEVLDDPSHDDAPALLADLQDRFDVDPSTTLDAIGTRVAADHPTLSAEAATMELRDRLRIGLVNAGIDAETATDRMAIDLTGTELRERIEGTTPMTLREYAHAHHVVTGEAR